MIRWRYVLPRLAVVLAIWIALAFFFDPLLRCVLIRTGQALTGAKVEIGGLCTSIWGMEITLSDVEVADGRAPDRNLVEFTELHIDLETGPFLRRQFVVSDASLSGVKLGAARDTDGRLDPPPAFQWRWPKLPELPQFEIDWLEALAVAREMAARRLDKLGLESVEVAGTLGTHWRDEIDQLRADLVGLLSRIDEVRGRFDAFRARRGAPATSLRDAGEVLAEIEVVLADAERLKRRLSELPALAGDDLARLDDARRRDERRIGDALQFDPLDPKQLTQFLLGTETANQVGTVLAWVDWARRHWPKPVEEPTPARHPGIDIHFATPQPLPGFLVRRAALEGELQFDDENWTLAGTLEGLTSDPRLFGQPLRLQINARGTTDVHVEAVVDATGDVDRTTLTVDLPGFAQPRRTLGDAERMQLVVEPGVVRMHLALALVGDNVSGELRCVHDDFHASVKLSDAYGGDVASEVLRQSLAEISRLEATIGLGGTLTAPEWTISSPLGEQLAAGFEAAIERQVQDAAVALARRIERAHADYLARFDEWLAAQQQELLSQLDPGLAELTSLARLSGGRSSVSGLLRQALPR